MSICIICHNKTENSNDVLCKECFEKVYKEPCSIRGVRQ
jgi:hypothetical protein